MNNKLSFLKVVMVLCLSLSTYAQEFKTYSTAVWIENQEGESVFYNTSYSSPNGFGATTEHAINQDLSKSFSGRDFGKFSAFSEKLKIKGVEVRTFKSGSGNVCGGEMNYRYYKTNTQSKPLFLNKKLSFFAECDLGANNFNDPIGKGPCNTSGYQKLYSSSLVSDFDTIELTALDEGIYTLELYYKIWGGNNGGCSTDKYDNNSGSNYKASFTICPTFTSIQKTNATCESLGKLKILVEGIENGVYSDRFFYGEEAISFKNVEVKDGVITISNLKPQEYKNVRYKSPIAGCSDIINTNILIESTQDCGLIETEDFKIYATAVWMYKKGSQDSFYNTSYSSPNGFVQAKDHAVNQDLSKSFSGLDFGTFASKSNTLSIKGAEIRTFKQNKGNVCGGELLYRYYKSGESTNQPDFTNKSLSFFAECDLGSSKFNDLIGSGPCNTNGFQKLQGSNFANSFTSIDLTNVNEGVYTLELYYKISGDNNGGCGSDKFDNNSGSNYKASFTICPTFVSSSIIQPTTENENGIITLNLTGVDDGVYSDRFMYVNEGKNIVFKNVEVKNGIATIILAPGIYKNIRYNSQEFSGCEDIIGVDVVIEEQKTCPSFGSYVIVQPKEGEKIGQIVIQVKGIKDGVYNDGFIYSNFSSTIKLYNVEVKNDVATIPVAPGRFNNIRYESSKDGCQAIGGFNVIIYDPKIESNIDLKISGKADKEKVYAGEEVTFEFSIENIGSDTANKVQISDLLPNGYQYINHWFAGASRSSDEYLQGIWTIISLPNESKPSTLIITAAVLPEGNYTITPKASSLEKDSDESNNQFEVKLDFIPLINLAVRVTSNKIKAIVGEEVSFYFLVENIGSNSATGTVLSTMLPSGYKYISHSFTGIDNLDKYSSETGIWSIGGVPRNAMSSILTIKAVVLSKGDYKVISEVKAIELDVDLTNNKASNTIEVECDQVKIIAGTTDSDQKCGIEPYVIKNISLVNAKEVLITSTGLGDLSTITNNDTFDLVYMPIEGDMGNQVLLTLKTNNNLEKSCGNAELKYTIDFTDCFLGIKKTVVDDLQLSLYPNPVQNQLTIKHKNGITIQSIEIYNSQSELVVLIPQVSQTSFDVSNLPNGIYFVKVNTDKGATTIKLVKN